MTSAMRVPHSTMTFGVDVRARVGGCALRLGLWIFSDATFLGVPGILLRAFVSALYGPQSASQGNILSYLSRQGVDEGDVARQVKPPERAPVRCIAQDDGL